MYHILLKLDCYMDGQEGNAAYDAAEILNARGICPFMLADRLDVLESDLGGIDDDD